MRGDEGATMRGGYLHEGGMLWFDPDGRLVIWERGVALGRWSRAGDQLTVERSGETTRWTVFSEGDDHALLVAHLESMQCVFGYLEDGETLRAARGARDLLVGSTP